MSINRSIGIVNLTVLKMQLELSVGSKSLIGRCELCMFHLPKDKIYVNLTVRVPRGTREEKEVFESVVTSGEMEVGPPEPPCRGRL